MIEVRFTSELRNKDKNKMFEALVEAGKKTNRVDTPRLERSEDEIKLWCISDLMLFDFCKYEETENGIKFHIAGCANTLPEIIYYYFPRTFKMDAFIFIEDTIYFYSFDEFLKIENGKVYLMKLDNIMEIEHEIQEANIRGDILEMVEKSK